MFLIAQLMQGSNKRASHSRPTSPLSRLWCGPKKDGAIRKTGPSGIQWDQIHPPTPPNTITNTIQFICFSVHFRGFPTWSNVSCICFQVERSRSPPFRCTRGETAGWIHKNKEEELHVSKWWSLWGYFFFSTVSIKHGQECYSLRIFFFFSITLTYPIPSHHSPAFCAPVQPLIRTWMQSRVTRISQNKETDWTQSVGLHAHSIQLFLPKGQILTTTILLPLLFFFKTYGTFKSFLSAVHC